MGVCLPKAVLTIFLFIFNIVFLICGIASIAVGVVVAAKSEVVRSIKEVSSDFQSDFICYGLIASGVFMLVVAVFGFVATSKEDKSWAFVYAICMVILLAMNVALCVFILKWHSKLQTGQVRVILSELWEHKNGTRVDLSVDKLKAATIDLIQKTFECCGIDGPQDYEQKDPANLLRKTFPGSCCPKSRTKCEPSSAYQNGCQDTIEKNMKKYSHYIRYVPIMLAIIIALGTIFGFCYAGRLIELGV